MVLLYLVALLLNVVEVKSVCNSTDLNMEAKSLAQVFSSPNYPNNYPEKQNCLWNITAPERQLIKLIFKKFKVSAYTCSLGDYVEVRDGQNWDSAVVVGQFCDGNIPPFPIYSQSRNLLVRFFSDRDDNSAGFQAEYKAFIPGISCSGKSDQDSNILLSNISGMITSPKFPSNYPNNLHCVWKITLTNSNTAIKLTFNSLQLPAAPSDSSSCGDDGDYVEVVDGYSFSPNAKDAIVIGTFCGIIKPGVIYSSGKSITVRFKSNNLSNTKGFSLTYYASPLTSVGKCGTKRYLHLEGKGGTFFSAGFPIAYPKNTDCTWYITVPAGSRVLLTFYKFELESDCSNDYAKVLNGRDLDSPQIGATFCGNKVPQRLISTERYMSVIFHSDVLTNKKGFLAKFEAVAEGTPCPVLTAPADGNVYPQSCKEFGANLQGRCFYNCSQGFSLKGNSTKTCQGYATWDSQATPSCTKSSGSSVISGFMTTLTIVVMAVILSHI